jgi:hypothetical protein
MRGLDGNFVLALDEAAGKLARRDVLERDVALGGAKERNPGTDEHGNPGDYEALNESRLKKPLNSDPAIHVNMSDTASGQLRHDAAGAPDIHSTLAPRGAGASARVLSTKTGFPP